MDCNQKAKSGSKIESNLSWIPPNPELIMKLVGQSSIKPLHDYGMKVVFLAVL
jgi:hypothetical protein